MMRWSQAVPAALIYGKRHGAAVLIALLALAAPALARAGTVPQPFDPGDGSRIIGSVALGPVSGQDGPFDVWNLQTGRRAAPLTCDPGDGTDPGNLAWNQDLVGAAGTLYTSVAIAQTTPDPGERGLCAQVFASAAASPDLSTWQTANPDGGVIVVLASHDQGIDWTPVGMPPYLSWNLSQLIGTPTGLL